MPMMDLPMMTGDQVVVERRVGEGGIRGLSPGVLPVPIVLATLKDGIPAKQSSTAKVDMTLSDCDDVQTPDNPDGPLGGEISPAGAVYLYMDAKLNRVLDVSDAKVTVIERPKHGSIAGEWRSKTFGPSFAYVADSGFLGTDQMSFLVEVDGKRYKVIVKLYVVPVADSKGVKCFGGVKRISGIGKPEGGSTATLSVDWLSTAIGDTPLFHVY